MCVAYIFSFRVANNLSFSPVEVDSRVSGSEISKDAFSQYCICYYSEARGGMFQQ